MEIERSIDEQLQTQSSEDEMPGLEGVTDDESESSEDIKKSSKDTIEIQTRSDAENTKWPGICIFFSIKEARAAYLEDKTIWKISWNKYRYVPKYNNQEDKWSPLSEQKIASLNSKYSTASDTDLFWVYQHVILPDEKQEELVRALDYGVGSKLFNKDWEEEFFRSKISTKTYYTRIIAKYMCYDMDKYEEQSFPLLIEEVLTDTEFVDKWVKY
jgi:hypothetical protein